MTQKRNVRTIVVLVALFAVLAVSVGAVFAQGGTRGGRGGYGNNQQGGGLNLQDPTLQGTMGGGGLYLHDPTTGSGMRRGGQGGAGLSGGGLNLTNLQASGDLTAEAIEALNEGIQDEYHAYAVYQVVIDSFGPVAPFVSIQRAEASHIDALAAAFERYGLDVPDAEPLTESLSFASVEEACALGAAAEIANFELYDAWIDTVSDYPDLVQVFTALRDASQYNHLPAFEACAN